MEKIFGFLITITTITIKAQVGAVEYPSGYLSEEKITQILEKARKSGTKDWELQKTNAILHKQLENQKNIHPKSVFNQRIVQPQQIMAGCVYFGFLKGNCRGWKVFHRK